MFKPRNTKKNLSFDQADRAEFRATKDVQGFFKNAMWALEERGHEDAAFYFNQVFDHLKDGGDLDADRVNFILGL